MYLYIFRGGGLAIPREKRTEILINKSLDLYGEEMKITFSNKKRQIVKEPRGKPYFKENPLCFSVSHTKNLWAFIIDQENIGLDIQEVRPARIKAVASRYFTLNEQEYIEKNQEEAFFQIWTRKEAYGKYTGKGITSDLKEFDTLEDNEHMKFIDLDIAPGIKAACCMREEKKIWIREIS
ncbi:MAG: 4'-phosphopantetheinyl transferase superfamily protein [Anaerovoracaceae bacterium]